MISTTHIYNIHTKMNGVKNIVQQSSTFSNKRSNQQCNNRITWYRTINWRSCCGRTINWRSFCGRTINWRSFCWCWFVWKILFYNLTYFETNISVLMYNSILHSEWNTLTISLSQYDALSDREINTFKYIWKWQG